MSFQQSDLDRLDAALVDVASGAAKVRFADGREVTYQSPEQILAARKVIEAKVRIANGQIRRRLGVFRRGA